MSTQSMHGREKKLHVETRNAIVLTIKCAISNIATSSPMFGHSKLILTFMTNRLTGAWGLGPRLGGFLGETMVVSTVLVQPLNHVKKLAIKTEEPLKIVLIFALKVKTQIMCK